MPTINCVIKLLDFFIGKAKLLQSPMLLLMRLWIAQIFFLSGQTKIHDFSNTLYLFQNEYAVPVLPPVVAAVISILFELGCPILLTLGLATRLATLPLLAMTAVIQFTYDQNIQHTYWAMSLAVILSFGPGLFSIDNLIKKKYS